MNPTASAEARIKQLCCLGVGGAAIMPAVLAELHELIPSYANGFTWSAAHGRMGHSLVENIDQLLPFLPVYFEKFCNRGENEVTLSFQDVMLGKEAVLLFDEMLKVDRRAYFRHDYYNLFCREVDFHTSLKAVAREGGVALGGLGLHRCRGDPEFDAEDKRLLTRLMPFIAHALTAAPSTAVPLVDSDREGFVIADAKGRVRYLSADARRLLALATRPTVAAGIADAEVALPGAVVQICARLATVLHARESTAAPPVHHLRNCLGGFSFRAHGLDRDGRRASAPEPTPLIGIHIRHQEPLKVHVVRRLRDMPSLSRRQMQICLLLVEDVANTQIASRMNMSAHTVVTHTRRLYDKLGVHNRPELVAKLTAP